MIAPCPKFFARVCFVALLVVANFVHARAQQRPLLTEFEAEALRYLALGLSNWAIARKCSLSLRGVESRLATLYEKLFPESSAGTENETYDKLAYNTRTRAFFESLRRGLINSDELEKDEAELKDWIERDRENFREDAK